MWGSFILFISLSEWDADGDVAVNGDGQEVEDGVLREDQYEVGDEEVVVVGGIEFCVDGDGEGDGKDFYSDVGRCQ